jgi:type II secretory pathway pseudopilin PulG
MNRRHGYSLIEMLVVMVAVVTIMGLFIAGALAVRDFQRSQRHATEATVSLDRLANDFRDDARRASRVDAEPRAFEAGIESLTFTTADGGVTRWTIADNGRVVERRSSPADGSTGGAESYRLEGGMFAAGPRFGVETIAELGAGTLASIEWPTRQVGGGDGLRVEALVRSIETRAKEDRP